MGPKFVRSHAVDLVLVGVLLFAGTLLVRNWIVGSGPRLKPVNHPSLDALEPVSRRHIQAVRHTSEQALGTRDASRRERATAFGKMGSVYLAYDFSPAAGDCFRNAGALEPDAFRWPYLQARSLLNSGKTAEAAAAMTQSLKLMDSVTVDPAVRLAALSLLGESAVRLNRPTDARKRFEAALQVEPDAPFALVRLGQLASRAGDSDRAITYFQRALAVLPNRAEIRSLLAAEYRRHGDAVRADLIAPASDANRKDQPLSYADPIYASVMELNQSGAWQNRLGAESFRVGRWRWALVHFKRAVDANPGLAQARANYGRTLLILGNVQVAQKQLEEAYRGDPQSGEIHASLCSAWAALPATRQKALADALAWRRQQPGQLEPISSLADVYMRLGRYSDALGVFAEWEHRSPADTQPRIGRARMLAALGRNRDARQTLEEALRIFPSDPDLRLNLARFLVAGADTKVRDGKRGLELSQELLDSQYSVVRAETLSLALAANGRWDEAAKIQRRAINDCGEDGDPSLRERLPRVLRCIESRQVWREQWPFREIDKRVN